MNDDETCKLKSDMPRNCADYEQSTSECDDDDEESCAKNTCSPSEDIKEVTSPLDFKRPKSKKRSIFHALPPNGQCHQPSEPSGQPVPMLPRHNSVTSEDGSSIDNFLPLHFPLRDAVKPSAATYKKREEKESNARNIKVTAVPTLTLTSTTPLDETDRAAIQRSSTMFTDGYSFDPIESECEREHEQGDDFDSVSPAVPRCKSSESGSHLSSVLPINLAGEADSDFVKLKSNRNSTTEEDLEEKLMKALDLTLIETNSATSYTSAQQEEIVVASTVEGVFTVEPHHSKYGRIILPEEFEELCVSRTLRCAKVINEEEAENEDDMISTSTQTIDESTKDDLTADQRDEHILDDQYKMGEAIKIDESVLEKNQEKEKNEPTWAYDESDWAEEEDSDSSSSYSWSSSSSASSNDSSSNESATGDSSSEDSSSMVSSDATIDSDATSVGSDMEDLTMEHERSYVSVLKDDPYSSALSTIEEGIDSCTIMSEESSVASSQEVKTSEIDLATCSGGSKHEAKSGELIVVSFEPSEIDLVASSGNNTGGAKNYESSVASFETVEIDLIVSSGENVEEDKSEEVGAASFETTRIDLVVSSGNKEEEAKSEETCKFPSLQDEIAATGLVEPSGNNKEVLKSKEASAFSSQGTEIRSETGKKGLQEYVPIEDWLKKHGETRSLTHNNEQEEIQNMDIHENQVGCGVTGRMIDIFLRNCSGADLFSANGTTEGLLAAEMKEQTDETNLVKASKIDEESSVDSGEEQLFSDPDFAMQIIEDRSVSFQESTEEYIYESVGAGKNEIEPLPIDASTVASSTVLNARSMEKAPEMAQVELTVCTLEYTEVSSDANEGTRNVSGEGHMCVLTASSPYDFTTCIWSTHEAPEIVDPSPHETCINGESFIAESLDNDVHELLTRAMLPTPMTNPPSDSIKSVFFPDSPSTSKGNESASQKEV